MARLADCPPSPKFKLKQSPREASDAMSAMGPGCVKTRRSQTLAQQSCLVAAFRGRSLRRNRRDTRCLQFYPNRL